MRAAILLLCVVALSEGFKMKTGDRRQLVELLRRLETLATTPITENEGPIVSGDNVKPLIPKDDLPVLKKPISKDDLKPYLDELFNKPHYEDPWTFDLDRLYEFPGANFMTKMIEKSISFPGPFKPEMMQGFPVEGPPYMHWFLQSMQPQWMSAMMTFYGDMTGVPELFTRKMTMFALESRMTCPSAFFDMFVARWSLNQMKEIFATEDTAMATVFMEKFALLFPDMDRDTVIKPMAIEAAIDVHWWVTEEIVQHIYGSGFQDVARFSHIMYRMIHQYYDTEIDGVGIEPWLRTVSLEDLVYPAWYEAAVRCENGTQVLARYTIATDVFRRNYERFTDNYILGELEAWLSEKAYEMRVDFSTFNDDVINDVAERITAYVDETMSRLENILSMMTPPTGGYGELMNFFMRMQLSEEQENGFIREMFVRLGLPIETVPEPSNPVPNPMSDPAEPVRRGYGRPYRGYYRG